MKKLLVGILVLGTLSSFACEQFIKNYSCEVTWSKFEMKNIGDVITFNINFDENKIILDDQPYEYGYTIDKWEKELNTGYFFRKATCTDSLMELEEASNRHGDMTTVVKYHIQRTDETTEIEMLFVDEPSLRLTCINI